MSALDPAGRLAAAEAEAAAARLRLTTTLGRLQVRLNPRTLALQAARDVADRGGAAAQAGLDTAVRNPGAVAGVTAVAGLYLARHRIVDLFRRKPKPHPPGYRETEPGLGPQDEPLQG